MKYDNISKETIEEFFAHFKGVSIPDPNNYPLQFQFLIDSFLHYKKMQERNKVENA
jgi:hypothetical protein